MKILFQNLNRRYSIHDATCDGRYNTKEQCNYISVEVPSIKWLGKVTRKQCERCYRDF